MTKTSNIQESERIKLLEETILKLNGVIFKYEMEIVPELLSDIKTGKDLVKEFMNSDDNFTYREILSKNHDQCRSFLSKHNTDSIKNKYQSNPCSEVTNDLKTAFEKMAYRKFFDLSTNDESVDHYGVKYSSYPTVILWGGFNEGAIAERARLSQKLKSRGIFRDMVSWTKVHDFLFKD